MANDLFQLEMKDTYIFTVYLFTAIMCFVVNFKLDFRFLLLTSGLHLVLWPLYLNGDEPRCKYQEIKKPFPFLYFQREQELKSLNIQ